MNQARPRNIITPDSFSVAPELLGRPLASPWRRGLAMLIDMAVIAILIAIGWPAFFGTVLVFLLLRLSTRSSNAAAKRNKTRKALRVAAAIIVFFLGLNLWQALSGSDGDNDEDQAESVAAEAAGSAASFGNVNLKMSVRDVIAASRLTLKLRGADESDDARTYADSLVAMLKRSGASPDNMVDLRDYIHETTESQKSAVIRLAIDSAFAAYTAVTVANDSLAFAYSAALREGNESLADSLRTALGNVLAADRIASLRSELNDERKQTEELKERVDKLSHRGSVRALLGSVADDLGLGFGWFAVYFTSFLALMKGQTPGKRMLKMRVVRLDAKPIGWWIAFERFGGYVASATLGLLGFVQVLWDRNRQGLHDKVVETVVIRT